ncbi:reverse transcriptase [Trichonephila clavipes]|nr:reverse transcriptase [Trichonephila clavipes]
MSPKLRGRGSEKRRTTQALLMADFFILSLDLVTRTTTELAPSSPDFHTTPTRGRLSLDRFHVPSHVGIPGNEKTEQKAKQEAGSSQLEVPLTLRRSLFSHSLSNILNVLPVPKKTTALESHEKLATVGPIPRPPKRAEAVAHFRLTTGHDLLEVYLHWLDVAADESCPLLGHVRMDGEHLLQCTGLDD